MDMFQKGCLLEKSPDLRNNFHAIGKRNHVLSFSWKIIKPFMNLYSGSYAVLSRHGHNPFRRGEAHQFSSKRSQRTLTCFPSSHAYFCWTTSMDTYGITEIFLRKRGSAREKGEGRKEGASRWIQQGPIMMQMREKFLSTVSLCIPFILSSVY